MLTVHIITIFPEAFNSYFNVSILKRALEKKLVKIKLYNLRNWAKDKRKTVDNRPYGGGPGMILTVDVLYRAITALTKIKYKKSKIKNINKKAEKQKIVLLTPAGKQFNQKIADRYSKLDRLILVCGHYEGIDKRVEKFIDEKISIGPYVLTGGELPAMIITDAVTRLVPGVIKKESLTEESFSMVARLRPKGLRQGARFSNQIKNLEKIGEYPQYTRPAIFTYKSESGKIKKLSVPKVLKSGDHQKIKEWQTRHQ